MQRLEQKDMLEDITRDLESLANIIIFMGIGCKEYQIDSKEMWFLSNSLERLAATLKELEKSL